MNTLTPDIESALKKMFDENFQRLRAESGHSLSPEVKNLAWQQVVLYWRRLREIAESITDTEVRLNLPCARFVNPEAPTSRRWGGDSKARDRRSRRGAVIDQHLRTGHHRVIL